jgi:hypothetical protein
VSRPSLNVPSFELVECGQGQERGAAKGQQSRDKFLSSGQNVAIRGTTVGYYLFRRCEENRRSTQMPWEIAA